MNNPKIKRYMSETANNSEEKDKILSDKLTEVDLVLCSKLNKNLTIEDSIIDSAGYKLLDKNIIYRSIESSLKIFKRYLTKINNLPLDEDFKLNNEESDNKNTDVTNMKIKFIKEHKKYFPSTSKIDFNRVKRLLDNKKQSQMSLKDISLKLNYKYITLYRAVRNILGYRYINSSRLNIKSSTLTNKYQTVYFSERFSKIIDNNNLFIFIDESSFNSNKRSSKLWINSGKKNTFYDKGRISGLNLILASSYNQIIHFQLSKNRLNALNFIDFLNQLEKIIKEDKHLNEKYIKNHIYLIFDNCKIHKCNELKKYFANKMFNVLTLPSYSPFFNQCEYIFQYLKRNFYKKVYSTM